MTPDDRAALVRAAYDSITRGSQSFAAASRLFAPTTRERAWLLYAWCRAADDMTDGQELGGTAAMQEDSVEAHARLVALTEAALNSDVALPTPFAALRLVARETDMPRAFIDDHVAGFALDAADWRPDTQDDLLRYCYHVAGSVGCMMAVVMGVDPAEKEVLDRASDLGLAFQLANIARDIVPDAEAGRCYLPAQWLREEGLAEADIALPGNRAAMARMARRLVDLSRPYRASARIGAARLAPRSRLAVLAADAIYGAIGERVVQWGERAWDERVRTSSSAKLGLFAGALMRAPFAPTYTPRTGLWTRKG